MAGWKPDTEQIASGRLAGADLSGMALKGHNFRQADLAGADLAGADLREANFWGANLAGADLSDTHCTGGEFSRRQSYRRAVG